MKPYLGVEGGFVFFKDETDELADDYVDDGAFDVTVEQNVAALATRPFVGVELTENIALELGVMVFSQKTTADVRDGGGSYEESWKNSWRTVDYSVLLRPSADTGWQGFFARVGGHSTKGTTDFDSTRNTPEKQSESKSGALFGLGYDWFFGESKQHHALRFSFTHYSSFVGLEDDALNIVRVGYFYRF
ncbi:hypothetical protein P3G55_25855 [Leptospira sp. 96542]|nr:hypothetical protein [Leptospira sp. 96542]